MLITKRDSRKRFRADSLDGQDTAWVHSYDKVCNRPLHLAKPMWHSCGNDYHVACLYPTAHTALDGSAARAGAIFQLNGCTVRRSGLSVDHGAPCYEGSRAVYDVIDFSHLEVHGGDSGRFLGPVEGADCDVVPSCVNHANVRLRIHRRFRCAIQGGLNVRLGYVGCGSRFGLLLCLKRRSEGSSAQQEHQGRGDSFHCGYLALVEYAGMVYKRLGNCGTANIAIATVFARECLGCSPASLRKSCSIKEYVKKKTSCATVR